MSKSHNQTTPITKQDFFQKYKIYEHKMMQVAKKCTRGILKGTKAWQKQKTRKKKCQDTMST
jgi:hypothetical protein